MSKLEKWQHFISTADTNSWYSGTTYYNITDNYGVVWTTDTTWKHDTYWEYVDLSNNVWSDLYKNSVSPSLLSPRVYWDEGVQVLMIDLPYYLESYRVFKTDNKLFVIRIPSQKQTTLSQMLEYLEKNVSKRFVKRVMELMLNLQLLGKEEIVVELL